MSKYMEFFTPHNVKSSLVYITGYENKKFSGYIENPFFEGKRYFDNLTQFLILTDSLCNEISYPQRVNENRSFVHEENQFCIGDSEADEMAEKPIATFKLSILFRQNSSWQGSVFWIENRSEENFRSVLELVMLLDGALTSLLKEKNQGKEKIV